MGKSKPEGETNLSILLQNMNPVLHNGEFVFCTIKKRPTNIEELEIIGLLQEDEGCTLILPREKAEEEGLEYSSVFRKITLSVHSSLEAVGFLAAITSKLAEHGISVNPVSAYYHDHLFVPVGQAEKAMGLLSELITR